MKTITDDAVVIDLLEYREADRIVTLFSKEHGKLSGIARNARNSVKRFGGALELFARLSIHFHPNEPLASIRDADIVTIYPQIRSSLAGIAAAGYAAELVAALAPERYANLRVFRLLTAYLEHLDRSPARADDRHFFEMNLLNILGYRPPLEQCTDCGADLGLCGGRWPARHGHGLYCPDCAPAGKPLGTATIATLQRCLVTGRFGLVGFSGEGLEEADDFLCEFISGHLHRPLKSLAFLRLSP